MREPIEAEEEEEEGSHVGHVLLQLLHPLQGGVLGLGVLQQGAHVEHVVQVRLDLHLQLVALRVLQFLEGGSKRTRTDYFRFKMDI